MKDIEVKRRDWVKNAAIVFLAVMLVLTFFSNTIMNRSLPEVAAQYTQSATITSRIRGSGTVTANETFTVFATQDSNIRDIFVKVGEFVSAGDVLVTLQTSGNLEEAEKYLESLEEQLEIYILQNSPSSSYTNINNDIREARRQLNAAQDKRTAAQASLSAAQNEMATLGKDEAAYQKAKSDINAATILVTTRGLEESIAVREINTFFDTTAGVDRYDETTYISNPVYIELNNAHIAAQRALADAENALDRLRIDTAWTDLFDLISMKVSSASMELDSAVMEVNMYQKQLETLNEQLADMQKQDGTANSIFNIEVRNRNREIDKQREIVEALRGEGTLSEITAPVSGKITEISVESGKPVYIDNQVVKIEMTDRGYSLSIPVTSQQASRVRIGDFAEVDRGWWSWGMPISGKLTNIRPDPQNPAQGRLLVFDITGEDIENGMQLNVTMAQQSENYSVVVPNSAIRTDTNGEFVLKVETRSSPLRNRYIAVRVDVNILASDDTGSAITGAGLSGWDYIITTSNRPIEPGMQVRLVDNP